MTRRKRTKRKTTTRRKKRTRFNPSAVLLVLLAVFVALSVYVFFFGRPTWRQVPSDAAIEGILIGANIDLERSVIRKKDEDGIDNWRIAVTSKTKQDTVVRALSQYAEGYGDQLRRLDEKWIQGTRHTLYTMELGRARFLFVVNAPKPPPKKPDPMVEVTAAESHPRLAIILDDIGGHPIHHLEPLLDLKVPMTFAILPFLTNSTETATYLHQHHYEVMLHLPMEPGNYPQSDPGPGAIFAHFNQAQIQDAIDQALIDVPFVAGVNNHMGSKITANRALMTTILQEIKQRDLYFIDSRTHKSTIAQETSLRLGLRTGRRHVFLDSERTLEFSTQQLELAEKTANEQGYAIVIGHPYPTTIEVLVRHVAEMDQRGCRFVFASDLVETAGGS